MEEGSLVNVERVSRYYGPLAAVQGVSFDLQRRQVLGLLGPNGAGKTSLMKMIAGVLAMNEGAIRVAGHDLLEEPLRARGSLGFLPEQPPLYEDLTVDEYLRYWARLRGLTRRQARAAAKRARYACGLEDNGRQLLGKLSRGYRQRVGIAQAIVHEPPVVILDEPTSGLDPLQINEIRRLIRNIAERCGVILSTHILAEAQGICDRVLILNRGRVVLDRQLSQLARDAGQRGFRVALRRPPSLETLREKADELQEARVEIESIDERRYRIRHAPGEDIREAFAGMAATQGWGLLELIPEEDRLEETFLRVTRDIPEALPEAVEEVPPPAAAPPDAPPDAPADAPAEERQAAPPLDSRPDASSS